MPADCDSPMISSRNKKTKFIFRTSVVLILLAASLFIGPGQAVALISTGTPCPPTLPPPLSCFGGPILQIIPPHFSIIFPNPLDCYGPAYVIGPPKPGTFAVIGGISRVYKYLNLRYGANVLGIALPAFPFICGTASIVLKIGTSL